MFNVKFKIDNNIPCSLFQVSEVDNNPNFKKCKLKVFYEGETEDHRLFTKDFSEKLIKTLAYAPVVSKIDEEEQDFKGHAPEQEIFGIVDPNGNISFETENSKTWAVCDVILYTERPDHIGEWAKKIPNKCQSLELNPKTVKYKINYDEKRKFKNIQFTEGSIVGVSVLGDNQKPAFTGSGFFNLNNKFEETMNKLKEFCDQENKNGNMKVNENETTISISSFIELSWSEKYENLYKALMDEYQNNFYVVDPYDNYVVIKLYHEETNDIEMVKILYTIDENGQITLGNAKKVRVCYEEMEEDNNFQTIEENSAISNENSTVNVDNDNADNNTISTNLNSIQEPINNEPQNNNISQGNLFSTSEEWSKLKQQIITLFGFNENSSILNNLPETEDLTVIYQYLFTEYQKTVIPKKQQIDFSSINLNTNIPNIEEEKNDIVSLVNKYKNKK